MSSKFSFLKKTLGIPPSQSLAFHFSQVSFISLSIPALLICLMLCSWTFAEPMEAVSLTSQWPTPWHRFASMAFSSDITPHKGVPPCSPAFTTTRSKKRAFFEWHAESFQRNSLRWVKKQHHLIGAYSFLCISLFVLFFSPWKIESINSKLTQKRGNTLNSQCMRWNWKCTLKPWCSDVCKPWFCKTSFKSRRKVIQR